MSKDTKGSRVLQPEARVRESFGRQGLMATFSAEVEHVSEGEVRIATPIRPKTSQQHGFAHAGLTFALGDSAAGYAALTVMDAGMEVVTSEIKVHLLAPAVGHRLIAEGRVIKPGRRFVVAAADVHAEGSDGVIHVATLLGTMVPVAT